jgi:hypothetical protein
MSDQVLGTLGEATKNDMFHSGRGYMSFYIHRAKESFMPIHLLITLVGASGRWAKMPWRNLFCRIQRLSHHILSFQVG